MPISLPAIQQPQVQQVDLPNTIASFISLGQRKLDYQKAQDTYGAAVQQANANASSAQSKATVDAANVNPLIAQQAAATDQATTQARASHFALDSSQAGLARQIAGGLAGDPDITAGKDPDAIIGKIAQARQQMIDSGIPAPVAESQASLLITTAHQNPGAVGQTLKNMIVAGQAPASQSGTVNPSTTFVPTKAGVQPFNTNSFAPGGVGPQGTAMTPPNQVTTDTTGAPVVVNPTDRTASQFQTGNGPQLSFPVGENAATQSTLQQERTDAKTAVQAAPTQHDINRNIVSLVDQGTKTGAGAAALQGLSSKLGFSFSGDQTTDYNLLGKYLERSAITAAQGMGPHTNAGLEAQVRANGSTDYTPQAIRKIATLNDAITTGSTLYQGGLENAINSAGGSVFAKRQFDQQWSQAMNPSNGVTGIQALRLKNAVDNNDPTEQKAVLSEVGGPGSAGAKALFQKLQAIRQLSGQ